MFFSSPSEPPSSRVGPGGTLVLHRKAASLPSNEYRRLNPRKGQSAVAKACSHHRTSREWIDCFSPFSWLPDQPLNDKPFLVFPVLTDHFCSSVRTKIKLAQAVLEDSPGLPVYILHADFLYNQILWVLVPLAVEINSTWIPRTKCLVFWPVWGSWSS